MKPHPRIRKTIKWGGAALTVLLVAAWTVSGWWFVGWAAPNWIVAVGVGSVLLSGQEGDPYAIPSGVLLMPIFVESKMHWWVKWSYWSPGWELAIPLWMFFLPALLITALAFRLDTLARRRANMNLCPKCHYDRTGLAADAVCPECGTLVKSADPSPSRPKASS